jgi:hypothetical protein
VSLVSKFKIGCKMKKNQKSSKESGMEMQLIEA